MNIFFLAVLPERSANMYMNTHLIKIILEITQLLWTAIHFQEWTEEQWASVPVKVYKKTHFNHPMAVWVRTCNYNYKYTCTLGLALCKEYTSYYHKEHACQVILEYLITLKIKSLKPKYKDGTVLATLHNPPFCSPVPLCMPAEYKEASLVASYRNYYRSDKLKMSKAGWIKGREIPFWI